MLTQLADRKKGLGLALLAPRALLTHLLFQPRKHREKKSSPDNISVPVANKQILTEAYISSHILSGMPK